MKPLFDRVVIKELEPGMMRKSGLVVPPGTSEPPPQHGIVLAVGQGVDWWEAAGVRMPVKPGDHVVFPADAGTWVLNATPWSTSTGSAGPSSRDRSI